MEQWQGQHPKLGSVTSNCTAPHKQAPFTVSRIGSLPGQQSTLPMVPSRSSRSVVLAQMAGPPLSAGNEGGRVVWPVMQSGGIQIRTVEPDNGVDLVSSKDQPPPDQAFRQHEGGGG